MSAGKATPFKRFKTRHRGITYRKRANGERTYYVSFGGRYHSASSERDAVALQGELRAKAARGEKTGAPSKLAFSEIAEKYYESKQSRLRASTRKEYRSTLDRILIPKFGTRKIGSMTVEDVAGLIRDLEARKLKPSTIQAYLIPMHGVMAYAVRKGFIPVNPCDQLTEDDRPHRPDTEQELEHVWSDEEMKALVAAAENMARQPEARYDYSPLLRTALATGLRQSELLGLQWKDIDLREKGEKMLHVRRQYTRQCEYTVPKTKAGIRRVPLADDLVRYLREHKLRSEFSKDEDPVFAAKKSGRPLTHRNTTRRGFEPAAAKAALTGVSFHSMRHAYASRMIANGISSTELAKVMGHESSGITEKTYINLFDKQRTDDRLRAAAAW